MQTKKQSALQLMILTVSSIWLKPQMNVDYLAVTLAGQDVTFTVKGRIACNGACV